MNCPKCSSILPDDSEFCAFCGEKIISDEPKPEPKTEHKSKSKYKIKHNKHKIKKPSKLTIGFMVLSIVLVALNIFQLCLYVNERDEAYRHLANKENEYNRLSKAYDDILSEYEFYHRYAVVVYDDGHNQYHKYGCLFHKEYDGLWIYNSEAAESQGYAPCPFCQK